MKYLIIIFSLVAINTFADGQNTIRRNQEEVRREERGYVPEPEKKERTYSAPIEREDELREEMEIDEERDKIEEQAREF